jgi:hypothetical protein
MLKVLSTTLILSLISSPVQALTNVCVQRETQQLNDTLRKIQRGNPSLTAITAAELKHPKATPKEILRYAWGFDSRTIAAKKQFSDKVQQCR